MILRALAVLGTLLLFPAAAFAAVDCVSCHKEATPGVVNDWQLSKHRENNVDCSACHGSAHTTAEDFAKAEVPTPDVCAGCHPDQVAQYKKGKHSLAWVAQNAMPTTHYQPMELIQGMKGCGGCHKIGTKSEEEVKKLRQAGELFGNAACDSCHTRHLFSVVEARSPQACQTCHMGFDHPQWEMYSSSKHGVRYLLKQQGVLQDEVAAPACQTCHMQNGNHEVRTAWGFLAVRLPLPEDPQWKADQVTILKALGVLNPDTGEPTGRLDAVKAADVARLTQEAWDAERNKMLATCGTCHSENFARNELQKGDRMIREADRLLAQGIAIVASLYKDGILEKPKGYAFAYPDLLAFHDAPTHIEQILFEMHLQHRMRTFQGTFHANPDYALWYGWSAMTRDLTQIKELAADMRRTHAKGAKPATAPKPAAPGKKTEERGKPGV